jgi:ABC-type multidrug transport system ATPase subunit
MATSKQEGTALIETLAGINERLRGDILINGQHVSKALLREICGFVPAPNVSSLDPRMSVQSTLSFHAALKGPVDRSDLKERVINIFYVFYIVYSFNS